LMLVKCRSKVTPRLPSKLSGCCACEQVREWRHTGVTAPEVAANE